MQIEEESMKMCSISEESRVMKFKTVTIILAENIKN
jgi:hypothetical protein